MGVIPHGNDNQPSGTFSDEAIRAIIQIAVLQVGGIEVERDPARRTAGR